MRQRRAIAVLVLAFVVASGSIAAGGQSTPPARVIVELALTSRHVPEGRLSSAAAAAQRRAISSAADRVAARLPLTPRSVLRRFRSVPYLVVNADAATRAALAASPDVVRVIDDALVRPSLAQSVPLIQGDQAWDAGYDGSGTAVAILDTGVDASHPFLVGKVIDEACFSSTVAGVSQSACPNGGSEQFGAGAAAPCSIGDCLHGTHVAGIAAGNGATAGQPFSGVAKGAHIVAVQVFSVVTDPGSCGGFAAPCAGAYTSDIIAGLEYVYEVAGSLNVVSANMSLGGATFTAPCDDEPEKPAIDNLRSIGVATVVAAGNNYSGNSLSSPACISSAISVGSIDKSNNVSVFSNVATFMSLFAPGDSITSSVPGGGFQSLSGTSMAAPHVTGTWAIMRQALPGASVGTILDALRTTGRPITDNRLFFGGGVTVPRVSVFQALTSLAAVSNPTPALISVSPSRIRPGIGPVPVVLTGHGFNLYSSVYWNGTPLATTVTSAATLQATVPLALITGTSAQITVTNPSPGGGSAALTLPIDPPVTLSVSTTTTQTSVPLTVTLTNGLGGATDWIGFAASSAPYSSYVAYVYIGSGVTTRTWTVTPSTPGTYEFRYFPNNGSTPIAISPAVTITQAPAPVPVLTSTSPVAAPAGGAAFTLNVNGSSFTGASVVRWNGVDRTTTFVSSSQLQAAIGAADIAATGTAQLTVFTPAPGGGTSAALAFPVVAPPVLTVSATSVGAGASLSVTLSGGLGGATDWIALAPTSAANTSYVAYTYIGSGVTTRTWTVTAPATPGTYEFRLFLNNGYVRAATSPTVNVIFVPPSVPVVASLSPSSALAGSPNVTLTVNGSGFTSASVVNWNGSPRPTTFVSGTQLTTVVGAADLTTVGSAQVSVTTPPPGGGTSGSLTFSIASAPTLSVNTTTAGTGSSITATLKGGLGGGSDWIAFAPTTAANTSFVAYTYVGSGVTTRTWTVTAPATPGTYEFRLFLNNGYTRAATSPAVTVVFVPPPAPSVNSISPSTGVAGAAGVTVTVTGANFVPSSTVNWNGTPRATAFVSATQLTAAIPAADLAAVGTALVSVVTPAPGGGTSGSVTFTIAPTPMLTVSTTTAAAGSSITVTLTGGLGGLSDWIALAPTSAPNTSYVAYTYIGGGVTTRTWTVTAPATPGTYEFRLFLNNGYTRAATSVPVTVQ